jgi:hypothetical protein
LKKKIRKLKWQIIKTTKIRIRIIHLNDLIQEEKMMGKAQNSMLTGYTA